jgi:hypothetical protein
MSSPYENIRSLAALTSPSRESLKDLEEDWQPDLPPINVAAGTIGRSLASNMDRISTDEMRAAFDLAEKLLIECDDETSTAIATGFLESLLSQASSGRLNFRRVGPMLGDESRKYCREWDRFTGVVTDGLDGPT